MKIKSWAERRVDDFVEDPRSWRERQEIVYRRKRSLWAQHSDWLRKHHWTARTVIVLGEITIGYAALVFGMLIGVAIR